MGRSRQSRSRGQSKVRMTTARSHGPRGYCVSSTATARADDVGAVARASKRQPQASAACRSSVRAFGDGQRAKRFHPAPQDGHWATGASLEIQSPSSSTGYGVYQCSASICANESAFLPQLQQVAPDAKIADRSGSTGFLDIGALQMLVVFGAKRRFQETRSFLTMVWQWEHFNCLVVYG